MSYWTAKHQADVVTFLSTGVASPSLIDVLYQIAVRSLASLSIPITDDRKQDVVIHLYTSVLPKIAPDKVGGSLQYLWMASRNYSLSAVNKVEEVTDEVPDLPDLVPSQDRLEVQRRILIELDSRLKGQRIANCTNAVFLMFLKAYVIDNDYDVRGFGAYIQEQMHLTLSSYRAICSRLGLRTIQFNEPAPVRAGVVAVRNGVGTIYPSVRATCKALNVDRTSLRECLEGRRKRVGEYRFAYLKEITRWRGYIEGGG